MVRTFYDVLEISPSASEEDVEAAYRERLKDTHPDLGETESSTDAVKAVIQAGNVLTDVEERRRYDRLGHEAYLTVSDAHDPSGMSKPASAAEREPAEGSAYSDVDERDHAAEWQGGGHRERTGVDAQNFTTSRDDTGYRQQDHRRNSATANVNPGGVDWATRTRTRSSGPTSSTGYAGPRSERSILLLSTLIAYPILAVSSLVPQFPLEFRIVIGACAVALVIYLVAVPSISIPVFGFWTLIAGVAVCLGRVSLLSIEGLGAMIATAGPLALAMFSYRRL